jgi:hypothetical protein
MIRVLKYKASTNFNNNEMKIVVFGVFKFDEILEIN